MEKNVEPFSFRIDDFNNFFHENLPVFLSTFWTYLTKFLLEWKTFQTVVVEKNEMYFMFSTLSVIPTLFEVNKHVRCSAYISKYIYRIITLGSLSHPKITVIFWIKTTCSWYVGTIQHCVSQKMDKYISSIFCPENCSSELLVMTYQTIWCHNSENHSVKYFNIVLDVDLVVILS
jgi:hypothetical protein